MFLKEEKPSPFNQKDLVNTPLIQELIYEKTHLF